MGRSESTEELVEGLVDYMGTLVPGMVPPGASRADDEDGEGEEDTSEAPPALPPKVRGRGDGVADEAVTVNGSASDKEHGEGHRRPPPAVPPRRRDKKHTPPVSSRVFYQHLLVVPALYFVVDNSSKETLGC